MTREVKANKNPDVVRVFVVRHGRTDFNAKKILQGHLDIDVNDEGIAQAQKVGEHLRDIQVDHFVSSDLVRCVSTSKEILKYQPHIESYRTTQNLRERNMGVVQGMPLLEALAQFGPDFKNLGEKSDALLARVADEWDLLFKKSITEGHLNTIVCTHGGVITGFINHLHSSKGYILAEGLTKADLKVPYNTSVSVIDLDKTSGKGIIRKFGNTEHLGGHFEVKNQLLR